MKSSDWALLAATIRSQHEPPNESQSMGEYMSLFAVHALANAADAIAASASQGEEA